MQLYLSACIVTHGTICTANAKCCSVLTEIIQHNQSVFSHMVQVPLLWFVPYFFCLISDAAYCWRDPCKHPKRLVVYSLIRYPKRLAIWQTRTSFPIGWRIRRESNTVYIYYIRVRLQTKGQEAYADSLSFTTKTRSYLYAYAIHTL